jgi:N-acetyltransferase 10
VDFGRRIVSLLGVAFRHLETPLVLAMLDAVKSVGGGSGDLPGTVMHHPGHALRARELGSVLTPHDVRRLEAYGRNLVDYRMVTDLVPSLAHLYFGGRLGEMSMSRLQAALLSGVGLQHRDVDSVVEELGVPETQALALFNKALRKMVSHMKRLQEAEAEEEQKEEEEAAAASSGKKKKGKKGKSADGEGDAGMAGSEGGGGDGGMAMLKAMDLDEYAVRGDDKAWAAALKGKTPTKGTISVRTDGVGSKRKHRGDADEEEEAVDEAPESLLGRGGKVKASRVKDSASKKAKKAPKTPKSSKKHKKH